jgi:redox-sensitive bicupin YhaK (pirin superfamily)
MTAGRGIVHSEMPGKNAGECHGLQLWVNLSKKNKMIEPNYQDLLDKDIPRATTPDGLVQVKIMYVFLFYKIIEKNNGNLRLFCI